MRKKIAAGNWKMNTLPSEGVNLAVILNTFIDEFGLSENKKVVIGVPFTHIESIINSIGIKNISVSAQNCSQFDSGAYTGEISAAMISSLGAKYVIVGHSERRQFFGDSDEIIGLKLQQAYKNNLIPIFCCGESLTERMEGNHFNVVQSQLINSLVKVDKSNIANSVIAYEPVWAIGTGQTATPAQAQEMHSFIRTTIAEMYGTEVSENISILYGGSVNAANALELFACDDIDGGLVGGASLKAEDFKTIIKSL
jgi:triosephosphate isomerase